MQFLRLPFYENSRYRSNWIHRESRDRLPIEKHDYKRFYNTHYECVQKGLGESYSILFDGEIFDPEQVESLELYTNFMCQKVEQPLKPEA